MTFQVEISPSALADAEEAYLWLRQHAPEHAPAWYDGLLDAVDSLAEFPERCALAPESEDLGEDVRELLYGRRGGVYRILFGIRADVVRIYRIRHSARRWLTPDELEP